MPPSALRVCFSKYLKQNVKYDDIIDERHIRIVERQRSQWCRGIMCGRKVFVLLSRGMRALPDGFFGEPRFFDAMAFKYKFINARSWNDGVN